MTKHSPDKLWMFRKLGFYPNCEIGISNDGSVYILYSRSYEDDLYIEMSRRDARLLAKRILQCLEETK